MSLVGNERRQARRASPGEGAFTLVELLVVLLLLSLLAATAAPRLSRGLPGMSVRAASYEVASALHQARGRAIFSQHEAAVRFNLADRRLQIVGEEPVRQLDPQIEIGLLTATREAPSDQVGYVRFFPDGSSSGGRIRLSREGVSRELDVHWLTGEVSVHEP